MTLLASETTSALAHAQGDLAHAQGDQARAHAIAQIQRMHRGKVARKVVNRKWSVRGLWKSKINIVRLRLLTCKCFQAQVSEVRHSLASTSKHVNVGESHVSYLKKLQLGVKTRTVMNEQYVDAKVMDEMRLIKSGRCTLTVEREEQINKVAIWDQGDAYFASEQAVRARLRLRRDDAVHEVLCKWWELLLKNRSALCTAGEHEPTLTYEGYRWTLV